MEQKAPPETKAPQANLLSELAKRKAQAQAQAQKKGHAFGHFAKGHERPRSHSWPAVFGGRNGQGKP